MNLAFNISLAGYLAALLLALAELFARTRDKLASVTIGTLAASAAAQTTWLVLRWITAGRPPFSNLFESLSLFAWTLVVVYLVLQWRRRLPFLGAATALLAVIALGGSLTLDSSISPLSPALRSRWLAGHVVACFLAYGSVAVAAIASAAWLFVRRRSGDASMLLSLEVVADRAITFGFLLLTLGIIAGAVWANSAWGSYWSWDPKETWALITWLIYAGCLHCRHVRGWRGAHAAWLSVSGFGSVIFTYAGVSFLMGGMHAYARTM